ncbi:MAG: immunoglobulin-like domain-containing protein, partial [Sulfurovum sp.]
MKQFSALVFSIIFLLFLNACGGGSSSTGSVDDNTTVDTTPPVITILGDNPATVIQNETYTDAGATALDDRDGPVPVIATGSVNTALVGPYTITYTATDSAGNKATDSRSVNVIADTDDNLTLDDFEDAVPHDPSFKSTHFSGSQNCAQCHDGITDTSNGQDVSIVKAWKGTMMDHAAIDPLYIAKVASEVQRNPNFKEVIEDKCSRCHMPMANVEAGFAGDTKLMFGDGFLNPENPHYDAAKEGVSCTLCHQIEDTPKLGTPEGSSGEFVIAENFGTGRVTYGPYPDNDINPQPMINSVEFTPKYSAHMNDSKLCSTCHNLDTPVIDIQTNTLNGDIFPEQAVYTEWEFSDFNGTKSCQECHMPQSEGSVIISTRPNNGSLSPKDNFYQHKFLGANTYMLDILKNNITKLGSAADTAAFETSIANTKEFLKASADVNIISTNFDNGTLEFSVNVTNHSGHKFPTSIPIRRAWLHVKVTNTADQSIVFESGAMNDNNQIIGVDDSTTSDYQEHHEEIDDASEVQVYEGIMLDTAGNQTYTFLNASSYAKDNRILPKG